MRVFISHSFKDEELASKLKETLVGSPEIKDAYMAQRVKEYELQIKDKIIKQINESDFVVAIITTNTRESASVNQELGYAQGRNKPKIIMLEKNAIEGILVHGAEKEEFTREKFEISCKNVLDYLIKNKSKAIGIPTYTEDELFVQESAHFRGTLESDIIYYLSDLLVNLEPDIDFSDYNSSDTKRKQLILLLRNIANNKERLEKNLTKLKVRNLFNLHINYMRLKNSLENAKQYPNSKLHPDERHAFLQLEQRLLSDPEGFDIIEHFQQCHIDTHTLDRDEKIKTIIENHPTLVSIPYFVHYIAIILSGTLDAIAELYEFFLLLRKRYGDMAFKYVY